MQDGVLTWLQGLIQYMAGYRTLMPSLLVTIRESFPKEQTGTFTVQMD